MEYYSNETVLTYFRHAQGFKSYVSQFLFVQIAHAVEHIHSKGYAHLDIKLNNIFLDEFFNVKVGDFGSAIKPPKSGLISKRRGTTNYMAPEVVEVKAKFNAFKADVYSLGVCLFILLFKTYPKLK